MSLRSFMATILTFTILSLVLTNLTTKCHNAQHNIMKKVFVLYPGVSINVNFITNDAIILTPMCTGFIRYVR